MAEKKLSSIDEVDVDAVAKDVTAQMKAQKQKNKINAILKLHLLNIKKIFYSLYQRLIFCHFQ